MAPNHAFRRIHRGTTVGVVGLAVAGFAMSYGALYELALEEGVPRRLAWLWPLVVDGFIVVASLAVLHAVLEHRPTFYPWTLVLGFSAVSVLFNVIHAAPTAVARLVAAVPPMALVFSFELLMRQVRTALETRFFKPLHWPRHRRTVVRQLKMGRPLRPRCLTAHVASWRSIARWVAESPARFWRVSWGSVTGTAGGCCGSCPPKWAA
jgi:hypothetical protein